jgi:hypothetical protein
MSVLAEAVGADYTGAKWNRPKILAAIRRFVEAFGPFPTNSDTYARHLKAHGIVGQSWKPSEYPSFFTILRYYSTLDVAARAAGVPIKGTHFDWTAEEDDFLRAFAGTVRRSELAEALGRHNENAVKRRLYDLGLTCRTAQGLWTLNRFGEALGLPRARIETVVRRRKIPTQRISMFVYIDPADAPDDLLPAATTEFQAAVLARRRMKLAALVGAMMGD